MRRLVGGLTLAGWAAFVGAPDMAVARDCVHYKEALLLIPLDAEEDGEAVEELREGEWMVLEKWSDSVRLLHFRGEASERVCEAFYEE